MFEGFLLGLVQGLTEFIPVSSSGHLILVRDFLHMSDHSGLAFDAVLQLATAFAILIYFFPQILGLLKTAWNMATRKPVSAEDTTLLKAIIAGTIPAIILGLLLESYMETVFRASAVVAWMLIVGSLLMLGAEWVGKQGKTLSPKSGFWIGMFQSLALIPGVSRSGATISGGLFLGLTREAAARFSFLLAFPIIFGSGLKKLIDLMQGGELQILGLPLLVGSVTAFVVGLAAIHFLIRYLKNHTLTVFIVYRIVLAVVILAVL